MIHIGLPGKEINKHGKYQEKRVSFKNIEELIKKELLKKPKFQTDLDEDKIEEMINSYKTHPEFLIFKNKIVIAVVIESIKEYKMYVVDGQHRIEMAKRLYEEKSNDFLNFCYFEIKTDDDCKKLFNETNLDSYKNSKYISLDDFKQNIYDEIRQYFNVNKSIYFADKKKETNKRYTICEFLNKLSENKIFEKFTKVNDLIEEIEKKNKLFCNRIEYKEYYKDEEICASNDIIYSLKNNNFIEYLIDNTITPIHQFKIKNKIPPKIRMCVWNHYFGNNENGKCPICNKEIKVGKNGFHCGHIISHANGGNISIDNLRPLCSDCNIDMGKKNWDAYVKKLSNQKIQII